MIFQDSVRSRIIANWNCHALMLVPNRGLNSGTYHDNPRYESLTPLLLAIFLLTNGVRNLQTNQAE